MFNFGNEQFSSDEAEIVFEACRSFAVSLFDNSSYSLLKRSAFVEAVSAIASSAKATNSDVSSAFNKVEMTGGFVSDAEWLQEDDFLDLLINDKGLKPALLNFGGKGAWLVAMDNKDVIKVLVKTARHKPRFYKNKFKIIELINSDYADEVLVVRGIFYES